MSLSTPALVPISAQKLPDSSLIVHGFRWTIAIELLNAFETIPCPNDATVEFMYSLLATCAPPEFIQLTKQYQELKAQEAQNTLQLQRLQQERQKLINKESLWD